MAETTKTFCERELDILNVLLNSGEPMTSTDIANTKRGNDYLTQSTVITVLRKLLKEGYIEVTGVTHSGNVLSRTYVATESAREDIIQYIAETYKPFVPILGISRLNEAIVSLFDEDTKEKLLAEIKKL